MPPGVTKAGWTYSMFGVLLGMLLIDWLIDRYLRSSVSDFISLVLTILH